MSTPSSENIDYDGLCETVQRLQNDLGSLKNKFNELRDVYEGLVITCQTFDSKNRKLHENIEDSATAILSLMSMSSVCQEIRIDQMNMFVAANPDIAKKYDIEAEFMSCSHGAGLKAWWGNAQVDMEIPPTERTQKLFEACYGVTADSLRRYSRNQNLFRLLSQRCTLYTHLSDQFNEQYDQLCEILAAGRDDYKGISEVLLECVEYIRQLLSSQGGE
ncbi:hypothetical protein TWF481_011059 [Arthrobotrys musiformis]|uniref:Uncharacterized protein n=1 Tax=Arthrobotrys musiformis TaxID=47236 RepID=A0AAV9VZB4_9PEZI